MDAFEQARYDRLLIRCQTLQEIVDKEGRKLLANVPALCTSMQAAKLASEQYNLAWFRSSYYSSDLQRQLALAFLDAAKLYPALPILDWQAVVDDTAP